MRKLLSCISILSLLIIPMISSTALTAKAQAMDLPDWVAGSKVKGDFRFRYQTEEKQKSGNDYDRDRLRIRLRAGVESTPNDQWTVGFGLATGKDANSGNQTLGDGFQSKDFYLDYAYAQYKPVDMATLLAGKFKNPLWGPKDLLWDSDINPEGIGANLNFAATENISLFLTPAYYVFNEIDFDPVLSDPEADGNLLAVQGGIKGELKDTGFFVLAGTYYQFSDIYEDPSSTIAGDQFLVDADAYSIDAEAGFTGLPVFVAVFGQYASIDVDGVSSGDDKAYLVGFKVGDQKIKTAGDWQLAYNYRKLESDSWVYTALGDSDFLGGNKAGKGSEVELTVGVAKNVSLGLDYYTAEEDTAGSDALATIQFDVNVKFP